MSPSWPDPLRAAAVHAAEAAARAEEIEGLRRLPADLAGRLRADGLMHLFLPAELGGPGLPPARGLAAIRRLAQADGATGWCAMIASTTALTGGWLAPEAARDIFAPAEDGLPPTAGGVYAPLGRAVAAGDGWRLDGRWPWASNSANCGWLLGGALVSQEGAPQMRLFLFPAERAVLHDTWHASGLCGTGSGDMEVADLHVPASRTVALAGGRPFLDVPLCRFPIFGLLALGVASVALGIARGALDDLAALAAGKRPQGARRTLAERPHIQAETAACEARWRAAAALVDSAVAEAWDAAQAGGALTLPHRAGLRLAAVHATEAAAEVATRMYTAAGGTAVFRSHPLQRRLRDVQTATQHAMVAQPVLELVGRALLGQDLHAAEL